MKKTKPRDPVDDLIDTALARQRTQLARQLRAEADAAYLDDRDPRYVAGLRHAAEIVRGGRTVQVPR